MTFAEKLKLYRERLDISRSELGRRTGLSRSIISRWERGERSPKIEQLDVLARFFNVDITDLFGDETPIRTFKKSPLEDLQSVYDKLTDEGREALLSVAYSFLYNPKYKRADADDVSTREASLYDVAKDLKPLEDMTPEEILELAEDEKKS